jgi:NADH dehydrogenase (ubiquinone) 1 alpha/beta subcomplex 1, acyl-carrier protein
MSSSIVLRSSLRALRTLAPITRPLARPMLRPVRPATSFFPGVRPGMVVCAQRWYSSGGTLAKDDIQRRIIEILQGFDKVTDPSKV